MLNISIAGNVGRNAELKDVGNSGVASFAVAVKGKDGTTWVSCSLWGKRANAIGPHLVKGQAVAVTGAMSMFEHNGKTYIECNVNDVTLLGKKPDQAQNADAYAMTE